MSDKPTKADDSLLSRLHYEYPYFESYVEPHGALKVDARCHACFYYAMLAMKARGLAGPIETQIIEYKVGETPPEWREIRDAEIAVGVATLYGLESPAQFLQFKREAWFQCKQLGVDVPAEVFEVSPKRLH